MNNRLESLLDLEKFGVRFVLQGSDLQIDAPRGVLTQDRIKAIKDHKPEIISYLSKVERLVPRGEAKRLIGEVFQRLNKVWPSGLEPDWAAQDQVDLAAMTGTKAELLAVLSAWERKEMIRAKACRKEGLQNESTIY